LKSTIGGWVGGGCGWKENINKNMLTEIEIRGKVNDRKRARDGGG
jgi:hypothetical protein